MDQTLAVTAETVAAMPSTELVGAWVLLTRAIAEQALADPERLAPCSGDALPRTFDERHTRTFTLQAQLEDIAVAAQEVTRAADAVLHAVAVEHEDTVAQRAHLDEENYGLCNALRPQANSRGMISGTPSGVRAPPRRASLSTDACSATARPLCTN